MKTLPRTLVLALAFLILATAGETPREASASRQAAKPAQSRGTNTSSRTRLATGQRSPYKRPAKLTPLQQRFKAKILRGFDPWGEAKSTRVLLSRDGGNQETFTFSNGKTKVRGRVYEKLGGIGIDVAETFNKVKGKWVPTENAFD